MKRTRNVKISMEKCVKFYSYLIKSEDFSVLFCLNNFWTHLAVTPFTELRDHSCLEWVNTNSYLTQHDSIIHSSCSKLLNFIFFLVATIRGKIWVKGEQYSQFIKKLPCCFLYTEQTFSEGNVSDFQPHTCNTILYNSLDLCPSK